MIFRIIFHKYILCLCIFSAIILSFYPAHAALKLKGSATLQEGFNPKPSNNDILLPMPCNMSMAFKLVAVPAKGFLWDMTTRFGQDDAVNIERGFYDSRHNASLSAPFATEDLPPAWQAHTTQGDNFYYLMGKYEISGLQWAAIMENTCPAPSAENIRPKTDITWYEAIDFSQKYTKWLLQNSPESLPKYTGDTRNVGFLRLPTEIEWEYAARGGHTSTSQEIRELEFFPHDESESYADYAVFRPEDASLIAENTARIGSRKANKLDLYDTAGNAAEMVMDVFRFSLGGRLHGSAGGFVRKGGSFISSTVEILPGRREEVAFFNIDGPMHARDLGFRLAISGINTPGGHRPSILQAEWKDAGENSPLLLDDTQNPLTELDRLLATALTDAEKENYQQLRAIIKDNNIALERQQMLAASSEVRTAAFMMETVRNFSSRIAIVKNTLDNLEILKKSTKDKKKQASINSSIKKAKTGVIDLERGFEQSLQFYKTKLEDTQNINQTIFDQAIKIVLSELGKGDTFSKKLMGNVQLFDTHIKAMRQKNFKAITVEQLKKDILNTKK